MIFCCKQYIKRKKRISSTFVDLQNLFKKRFIHKRTNHMYEQLFNCLILQISRLFYYVFSQIQQTAITIIVFWNSQRASWQFPTYITKCQKQNMYSYCESLIQTNQLNYFLFWYFIKLNLYNSEIEIKQVLNQFVQNSNKVVVKTLLLIDNQQFFSFIHILQSNNYYFLFVSEFSNVVINIHKIK
eukprot:TRINITY_DN3521_c0_g1_i10.p3 TRINITY_DN3521_c0_g1~~TRINITY_DN3521_c0_g1_i10.p3  ORF type:complete len:185 (-),score=-23.51 TRINITY_DN3521_c0_g1_i10:963-1517(-)